MGQPCSSSVKIFSEVTSQLRQEWADCGISEVSDTKWFCTWTSGDENSITASFLLLSTHWWPCSWALVCEGINLIEDLMNEADIVKLESIVGDGHDETVRSELYAE